MILAAAMILDAVFGEPEQIWSRWPHPAVLMGQVVDWCDTRLNSGRYRRAKGIAVMTVLILLGWAFGWLIAIFPDFGLLEGIGAAILLAQRSLVDHVQAVATALRRSLAEGREAVSMIVGRDTGRMGEDDIARAAIESAAENLSDGVVAPAFWFALFGLEGMIVYKIINTADSMIGHLTPRHSEFGWAAAKLDDLVNWIPARLTALLIIAGNFAFVHWPRVPNDARQHRSPNAGWPEAAMAPVVGVALSGPRSYDGEMQDFAWVNPNGRRDPGPAEIELACRALWQAWAATLGLVLLIVWVIWFLSAPTLPPLPPAL